jgi:hypothetical protein
LHLRSHDWLRLDVLSGINESGARLLRGEYGGPLPLTGVVVQRGPVGDLIGTSWANLYVVTSRVVQVLEQSDLTGWMTYPVAVAAGMEEAVGVWLLAVSGRSGSVYGVGGAPRLDVDTLGQYLDPTEWDGSDLFVPANQQVILLTAQAAHALDAARLRNLVVDPAGLEPTPQRREQS